MQDDMDADAEWVEKVDISPSMRKRIMALKVCRNRCLAHATSDTALDMATPVLRMFFALLEHAGSLHAENDDELVPPMRTHPGWTELTISSQPKSQSPYAVASSCVIATPFDGAKVCDFRVKQFSLACHYDTGQFGYCTIVLTFILRAGSLLSSSRRVFAQIHLSRYPPTITPPLQRDTLFDSP
jgi:hypothetical protein